MTQPLNVLIACEHTGAVRDAFNALGHTAVSNDLLPDASTTGGSHLVGDCREAILAGPDGNGGSWDIIIMHPPCTALAVSGNRWYGRGKEKATERTEAIAWTLDLWKLATERCDRVAMENPVGVLPMKATQYVQPWQFGHGETKKTGLWLHGLAPLTATDVVEGREPRVWKMGPSADRWALRSATYRGIAEAMADQWGGDLREVAE